MKKSCFDMKEKEVEQVLRDRVKKIGGTAYKFSSPGNSGVPDRLVVFPDGQIWFVELKTMTGRLTALQDRQCKKLIRFKTNVYVARGIPGVAEVFRLAGYTAVYRDMVKKYGLTEEDFKGGDTFEV